jgi:drug/metabolite transporter (DMT)-like permease
MLGIAFVVASAIAYGTVPIIAKTAFRDGVALPEFLTLRFALAAALLWAAVPLSGGGLPRSAHFARLFAMGAVGYGGQSAAFFLALQRLPASTCALLLYAYPAIVTLAAAALLHDRLTVRKVGAAAIGFAGTSLVVQGMVGGIDPTGVGFALLSAVIYSAYILFGSRLFADVAPVAAAAVVMSGTASAYGVFAAVTRQMTFPTDATQVWIIALAAVVGTAVPVLGFLAGMPRIGPSRASILSTFEPVVTVLLAAAVLGEAFRAVQIVGAICVIASVLLLESGRPSEPARM